MKVAGVDIADGSWLVVWMEDGIVTGSVLVDTLQGQLEEAEVVAIDIPLHLPVDRIGRVAEDEARRLLGPRSSTVFSSLPAELYQSAYTQEQRDLARRRFGRSFSKQSWNIGWAVLDAAQVASSTWIETHPELAFLELTGSPLPSKRSWSGVRRRIDALEAVGIRVPDLNGPVKTDDALDAAVCAHVATRYAQGLAGYVPHGGDDGRIWF